MQNGTNRNGISQSTKATAPLTGQGVRNLDAMAPPKFRNGRKVRKPDNYMAICPHPEEQLSEGVITEKMTGRDEFGEEFSYTLRFKTCEDCGAEVAI